MLIVQRVVGFYETNCEDWFFSLMLPCLKELEGREVLIDDNLNSHFSESSISACQKQYCISLFISSFNTTTTTLRHGLVRAIKT